MRKNIVKIIAIIVINLSLFGIGILILVKSVNREQQLPIVTVNNSAQAKIIVPTNLSQDAFIITNTANNQILTEVKPIYNTDNTLIDLPAGHYVLNFKFNDQFINKSIQLEPGREVLIDLPFQNINISPLPVQSGTFVNPLLNCPGYVIAREFGWVMSNSNPNFHEGVDLAKPDGCWINAIGDGKVIVAGWGGWGYTVIIQHNEHLTSIYGHGSGEFAVKTGDTVKAGQKIMYMGCSGVCTGTHLHLQIDQDGLPQDPGKYIQL